MLTQLTLTDAWRPPGPETALLPPVTYWSLITSFVEAERYNAQADYLSCFSDLAEAAGHTAEHNMLWMDAMQLLIQ